MLVIKKVFKYEIIQYFGIRRKNLMKGALVFLVVFVLGLGITLAYPSLPPGPYLYGLLNVPPTDYPVLGVPATTLVISVLNGVVYGVAAWLVFTVIWAATGRNKKREQVIQQTVNVNLEDKDKEVKTEPEKK
jgi:hypothetical protein